MVLKYRLKSEKLQFLLPIRNVTDSLWYILELGLGYKIFTMCSPDSFSTCTIMVHPYLVEAMPRTLVLGLYVLDPCLVVLRLIGSVLVVGSLRQHPRTVTMGSPCI
jgi:hypothetical protein